MHSNYFYVIGIIVVLFLFYSRYWFFDTPIFPSWVFDEATRCLLEKAATGESTLSEECLEVIRKNVHGRKEMK